MTVRCPSCGRATLDVPGMLAVWRGSGHAAPSSYVCAGCRLAMRGAGP